MFRDAAAAFAEVTHDSVGSSVARVKGTADGPLLAVFGQGNLSDNGQLEFASAGNLAAFLWNGRTLGRLLLGLRLVDTHGVAPAPGRAIVRAILASLSFVLFLGGFWMALFDRRGQTLHDKLTSTFVVQPS